MSAKLGVAQAHPGAGEAWRRQQNGSAPQAGKPRISGGNLMTWANNSPGHGGHRPLTYRGSLGSRRAPPTTQKERKHNPGTAPLLTTHTSPPITIRPPNAHARVFRECKRPQTGRMRRGRGGGGGEGHDLVCGAWIDTAALAVGGDTRRSLWHSPGRHCGRQMNIGGAGGVPVVAIRLGGRRRRLVECLGVEEPNRSQHTAAAADPQHWTSTSPRQPPH